MMMRCISFVPSPMQRSGASRYYYDSNERLLELSDSLHAAERFACEMRLSRP